LEISHPDPAVEARIVARASNHAISEAAAEVKAASNDFNGMCFNREQIALKIANLGLERVRLGGAFDA
jgi:hypothetical protein